MRKSPYILHKNKVGLCLVKYMLWTKCLSSSNSCIEALILNVMERGR